MKRKVHRQASFVALLAADWRLFMLCCSLVITFHGYSQTQLVKDINTQIGSGLVPSGEYADFTAAGPFLYYVMHGNQLWRTATAGYTASLIKEMDGIGNLKNVNGSLFFTAATADHGSELWKSSGTTATTVLVKDIRAGAESSSPSWLTNVGGTLFFVADDGYTGMELWKSDGSSAGTVRVKDIMQVKGSSNPSNLIASNGSLYFTANDGKNGYEIWKSNGTSSGTVMIKGIGTEYKVGTKPLQLTDVDGTVFFTAVKPTGERRLYKTDGTAAGTKLVSDLPRNPKFLTGVNGTLFFSGSDVAHGEELWKSDGTAAGTVLVKDITPGPGSENRYGIAHLSYLMSMGEKLYFLGNDENGQKLWVSDGTESGTMPIVGPPDVYFTWIDPNPISFLGKIYFNVDKNTTGELSMMRTDGTPGGEEVFVEDVAYTWDDDPERVVANNFLYYMRYGNLWKTDGTKNYVIRSPFTTTQSSNPKEITDINGIVYFGAYDGKAHGLWKSNGTKAGTTLVKHFAEPISQLTPSGNYLYYLAKALSPTAQTYSKLWRTDLTTGNSQVLSNINASGDDAIGELVDADGTLFFSAITQDQKAQLWKSGGEPGNTILVKTLNNIAVPATHLTTIGKRILFSTSDDSGTSDALWRSDGTAANTIKIKVFKTTMSTPRAITEMVSVNHRGFFIAYNGYDYEVWSTDGTGTGTTRLKDIRLNDPNVVDVSGLTNIGGTIYFAAAGEEDEYGQYKRDLWKTNGTAIGTVKVTSFPALSTSPVMDNIFILGGLNRSVLVGLPISYFDSELWTTDGTESGTQMLSLIHYDNFLESTVINNILYFTTSPARLWRSDGTVCGTYPALSHARLGDLTDSNGQMFLAYETASVGRELFTFNPEPSPCTTVVERTNTDTTSPGNGNEENVISYPNPFVDEFSLRLNGLNGESYQAMITDVQGTRQGDVMQLQFNVQYNLGLGLVPGVYILIVVTPNEKVIKKLIKSL